MNPRNLTLFLIAILINSLNVFGQGPTSHWYFGYGTGIRFQNGLPSHINNSAMSYSDEGTAAISDENGNLLFYGNPSVCYNSAHLNVQNGTGLIGDLSSTQGALIVPNPLDSSVYYYFSNWGTHRYSVIRRTSAHPLGEIFNAEKNIEMATITSERTTAVHHSNGKDIWVISRIYGDDTILAWLVDENGVNPNPVASHAPHMQFSYQGQLKSSPDGRYLSESIFLGSSQSPIQAYLHEFDVSTGAVTSTIAISEDSLRAYGTEFSADSRQVYFSNFQNGGGIYQYSLDTFDSTSVAASRYKHQSPLNYALQIGLDQKIYSVNVSQSHLSTIENPSDTGSNVILNHNSLFLQGNISTVGLPGFIQSYFHPAYFDYTSKCNVPVHFSANTTGIDSLRWDFGDSLNAINSSTVSPVQHTYLTQGYHTVTLHTYIGGVEYTFKRQVYARFGSLDGGHDTVYTCGDSMLLSSVSQIPFASYLWETGDTTAFIVVPPNKGEYKVSVTGQCGTVVDTIRVVEAHINVELGKDTTICYGASFVKSAAAPNASYAWSTGDSVASITIDTSGVYSVTISGQCDTVQDQFNVTLNPIIAGNIIAQPQTGSILLTTGIGFDYLWSVGDTTQAILITSPGTYAVTYSDSNGCYVEASIIITEDDFVGIADVGNDLELNVYPNPASKEIFIESNANGAFDVKLSDVAGNLIKQWKLDLSSTNQLGIDNLSNGLYILTLESNNLRSVDRIIVQHD